MKIEDAKKLLRIYRDALQVQDACNLEGVLHGFSRHITDLRHLEKPGCTDEINQHAVCFMFSYKIAALNGHEPLSLSETYYKQAESACERKIAELTAFIAAYNEAGEVDDAELTAAGEILDRNKEDATCLDQPG